VERARDAAAAKAALRRELRARRRAIPAAERERASRRVVEKALAGIDWTSVRSAHVYRSVAAWGEVDTAPLVEAIRERWRSVRIVSPDVTANQPLPEERFDVIVVPVLGFDDANFRLGLGAGFYDRLLAAQPQAFTIGLAYAWANVGDRLPHEPHDMPLDRVVTDA